MGLGIDRMDERKGGRDDDIVRSAWGKLATNGRRRQRKGCGMSKVAFCFPGPGLARGRDGKGDRRGGPGGDGCLPTSAARLGPRPRRSSASTRRSRTSSRPRCSSRLSSRPAWRSWPRCARRDRAGRRRRALGRRVRGACVGRRARDRRGDRARPRAWARDGRGRPAASRLDGRDSRSRGRGGRDPVPKDRGRLARQLQLPRPDRDLGRERGRRGVVRRGREPRRSTSDQAEGLRCVPQPTRRAGCRSSQARGRRDSVPRPDRAVHVDRDRESRARRPACLAARRPADRARAVHAGCARARSRRRHDVRRGGAGNVLSGLVKRIDRSVRTIPVNDLASLEKAREALST